MPKRWYVIGRPNDVSKRDKHPYLYLFKNDLTGGIDWTEYAEFAEKFTTREVAMEFAFPVVAVGGLRYLGLLEVFQMRNGKPRGVGAVMSPKDDR